MKQDEVNLFLIHHNGNTLGPFGLAQIIQLLAQNQISSNDFIWDDDQEDWVVLLDFEPLRAEMRLQKPKPQKAKLQQQTKEIRVLAAEPPIPMPVESTLDDRSALDWYLKTKSRSFGPVNLFTIIKGLQEKSISESDLIKKGEEGTWQPIALNSVFNEASMRALYLEFNQVNDSGLFKRRRYMRYQSSGSALVRSADGCVQANLIEVGEGGMALKIQTAKIKIGDELIVHLASTAEHPALILNARAVTRRFEPKMRSLKTPHVYGLEFQNINPDKKKLLEKWTRTLARSKDSSNEKSA